MPRVKTPRVKTPRVKTPRVKAPRIESLGEAPPAPRGGRMAEIRREFARVWPAESWEAVSSADPWGAALRRAAREQARREHSRNPPDRRARIAQQARGAFAALRGEAALRKIAEGLGAPRGGDLPPRIISRTALAYAAAGHRRALQIHGEARDYIVFAKNGRLRGRYKTSFGELCAHLAADGGRSAAAKSRRKPPVCLDAGNRWHRAHPIRIYPAADGFGIGILAGPKGLRRRIILREAPTREAAEALLADPEERRRLRRSVFLWWSGSAPKGHRAIKNEAARWADLRSGPPRRGPPRRGPPAGSGNVTAERFDREFRPRGLFFQKSIPQPKRRRMLNRLFDQACDLAELLDIPRARLFFGRSVLLALGGRGGVPNPKARGSYMPLSRTIFLNPATGGNALAHEWFHALDDHASLGSSGGACLYEDSALSRWAISRIHRARAAGSPAYRERSAEWEIRRYRPPGRRVPARYLSTDKEMGARAFEALMRHEAVKRNWRNTPVAGLPSDREFAANGAEALYPYPTQMELARCGGALLERIRSEALRAGPPGRRAAR